MKPSIAPRTRRAFSLAGVLVVVFGWAGCGQHASPSDPVEGRRVLLTALDAWKGGQTRETLANQTPPLHVSDGDWMSGLRLIDYKADTQGRLVGSDVNYDVVLEIKSSTGKVFKREAVYAVTTRPQLLVLRQDTL